MLNQPKKILIVAGEASADTHGAALLQQLRGRWPGIEAFGVGGRELALTGFEAVVPTDQLNVVGFTDFMDRWGHILRAYRDLKKSIAEKKPELAVLIDLPDFNLKLAGHLKKQGIPIVYYFSPQVWAWRKYRIRKIQRCVDRMLVAFPFEKSFYDQHGVDARFVGHPILETVITRETYRNQEAIQASPRIAVLPGSRLSEVRHHSPFLVEALSLLRERYPQLEVKVPLASTLPRDYVSKAFEGAEIELVSGDSRKVMQWADVALVASGTSTLECAVVGTPFSLFYVVSSTTAFLVKNILRFRGYAGLPNLLHGKEIVREYLQENVTGPNLAAEATHLIQSPAYRERITEKLTACRDLLGRPGASARAANHVVQVWENSQTASPESRLELQPAYT